MVSYFVELIDIAALEPFQGVGLNLSLAVYFVPHHEYFSVVLIVLDCLDQPVILQTLRLVKKST